MSLNTMMVINNLETDQIKRYTQIYPNIEMLPSGGDPCDPMNQNPEEFGTNTNTDVQDLFAQKIDYNANQAGSGGPISYNGNISTLTSWHKGRYNQVYSYTYDYLDRVKKGTHGELAAGAYSQENYYTERWDYDARGNITKLDRRGLTNRLDLGENCYQASTIDSLTYTYAPGTNKLIQVTDKAPCPEVITLPMTIDRDMRYGASQEIRIEDTDVLCGVNLRLSAGTLVNIIDTLKIPKTCGTTAHVVANAGPCGDDKYTEGFNQQSTTGQYLYDASGNQTYDPNKNLTYHYNYLNLPYRIVGGENDELQMLYSADGTLLQRKYLKNNVLLSKIDYLDGKELLNDMMTNINHQDGRVVKTTSGYSYEYYIKDHLGNVRVIFADDNNDGLIVGNERRSLHDYYAFGLEWNGNWKKVEINNIATNQRFGGKEVVNNMGLLSLDFHARIYDPIIGRFTSVDPLAEQGPEYSPYVYTFNNPIKYIDPDGRWPDNPGNPWYYLIEGFRQYFQAAGAVVDKITPTYQAKVYANVEVESKTSYGNVSVTSTATTENSVTVQQGSFEQYFKTGESPIKVNSSSLEVSTEQKVTVNKNVKGVTVYAENKTEASSSGISNKTSVGAKKSVGPVECSAQCYYQRSGSSNQVGASVKAEASKTIATRKAGNTETSISAKIGAQFSAFYDWITN